MKVWITKYALTYGIFERETHSDHRVTSYVHVTERVEAGFACENHFGPNEWSASEEDAKARAREMQQAKIKKLEKQMDKIRKLDFQ